MKKQSILKNKNVLLLIAIALSSFYISVSAMIKNPKKVNNDKIKKTERCLSLLEYLLKLSFLQKRIISETTNANNNIEQQKTDYLISFYLCFCSNFAHAGKNSQHDKELTKKQKKDYLLGIIFDNHKELSKIEDLVSIDNIEKYGDLLQYAVFLIEEEPSLSYLMRRKTTKTEKKNNKNK